MILKELKPFDVEKAKNGATIVDGCYHPVKILKYDLKSVYPILTIVTKGEQEYAQIYTMNGRLSHTYRFPDDDLYILEEYIDFETINEEYKKVVPLEKNAKLSYKLIALNKLFLIADYYNTQQVDWNNKDQPKYMIYYNNDHKTYGITSWYISSIGFPYFLNKVHAQSVIDNPNFKEILDVIFIDV